MRDIWPVDTQAELISRIRLMHKLEADPFLRNRVMRHYRENPVDWINDWCVTYDPRRKAPEVKIIPFVLFKRQREFIEFLYACLSDKQSGLCEKARDIGASWLCCAFTVWLWLFHEGANIGWGSRKEEYVDKKGDPKAIFPKIRMILQYLPVWMLPTDFNLVRDTPYMRVIGPHGSTITGEAGDNIGRGGRTTLFFKDESAHYEHPELIEAALGDNTDVQIDISSVNGSANVFYRRRMAGELWTPEYCPPPGITRVFTFDWRDHPGKTQAWYDLRRKKAENEGLLHIFAQEVDRDYTGSQEGIIIPNLWARAAVDAHIRLGFAAEGQKVAAQDVADGGGDKNALVIRHGVVAVFGDHWGGDAGEAAQRAIPLCNERGVTELYYDSIGVGTGFRVEASNMEQKASWNTSLKVIPWNAGAAPLDPEERVIPGDDGSPTNKDQYKNLKAQGWFRVRARFYRTYRAVVHGEQFDPAELISISSEMPLREQLILELSQAVRKNNQEGKTVVDKKPDGAVSPNLADAFIACYNPTRELSILDVL
jgi:phage terminase large subunit